MRPKAWVGRNNEASVGFSPSSPNGRSTEVYAAMTASNEPLPESLVGQQLGAYDVLARVGAGGMGEVYRARDTKLERDVALKILPATSSRAIPSVWRASSAKRGCWRPSIIRTSRRSMASKRPMACAHWSSSWSKARRWPSGLAPGRAAVREALVDRRARSPRRSTRRTRRASSTAT